MFVCVSGVGRETRPHSATVLHFITGPPSLENGLEGEWGAFRGLPTTAKGGCGGGGLGWRFISFHTPTSFSPFTMRTKKRRGLFIQPAFSSPLSGLPELRAPFLFSAEYPRRPSRSGQILSSQYPEPRNSRLLIPLFGLGECESKADPCRCDSLHFQDRLLSPFVCVHRFALFRAKLDGGGGGGDWDHFSGLSVQVSANALHLVPK